MHVSRLGFLLAIALSADRLEAQVTQRVSLASSGLQGNLGADSGRPSVRGRYVAFASSSTNLVSDDTNGFSDVFVRDLWTATTVRASVGTGGAQGNESSAEPSLSTNGRFVAFTSRATIAPPDVGTFFDVFVRDLESGTTEIVSINTGGTPGNDDSSTPSISGDGRFVAFRSHATNLVGGDTNDGGDIFVRDRVAATTTRVSVSSTGAQGNQASYDPSISADGRFVAFGGSSSNLAPPGTNFLDKVFLRDRVAGTTVLVAVNSSGQAATAGSGNPSISADGRFVAFDSSASNLVAGDANGVVDSFVRDLTAGSTERISLSEAGGSLSWPSHGPSISGDGRFVTFWTESPSVVAGDTNGTWDVFLRDRHLSSTEWISRSSTGATGNGASRFASITADGRYVAFHSESSDLVPADTNAQPDVFARDRAAAGFTALCDPTLDTVVDCPCSNPPGIAGRGCDNSEATGGALLLGSGIAYLSSDTLSFVTEGQRTSALSILLAGDVLLPSGVVYGQGVRCAGGTLRRLFTRAATGGALLLPDPQAGDPTISVRSAQIGDVLAGGATRVYLVYYRDPTVLGTCPTTSTFNATNSGYVRWSP